MGTIMVDGVLTPYRDRGTARLTQVEVVTPEEHTGDVIGEPWMVSGLNNRYLRA